MRRDPDTSAENAAGPAPPVLAAPGPAPLLPLPPLPPLAELVAEALARLDDGGSAALDAFYQSCPQQAAELRAHLWRLQRLGLI